MHRLNPEQVKAVETTEGRVLILAGAGSGKTRVLTYRMAHLIRNCGVPPTAILGLTFTNKAAEEMRQRIAQLVDRSAASALTLSTFHSFCMKVLRQDIDRLGYTRNFSLYDEKDMERLVSLIARDLLRKEEGELPSLAPTLAAISRARQKGVGVEGVDGSGSDWHDAFSRQVYERLLVSMRSYNAVDFDGLLWLTVELFGKFPEVLKKYQERYRYVMIDEYQDTNPVQYKLAELLTERSQNLCVVGDDDQSIYGWRGADVRNILQFGKAAVITLEQNYRSTGTILKAANAMICHNKERHQKMLWSNCGEGEKIEIFHAPTEQEEASAVVCRLAAMKERLHLRWSDFAILYRSNALSRQFEAALLKHGYREHDRWVKGIPYKIHGGLEFYERREVKDLLSYLRVVSNPSDQEAILRVINQPRRGVGEGALDKLTAYNRQNGIPLWRVLEETARGGALAETVGPRALKGVERFVAAIRSAQGLFEKLPLPEALSRFIEEIDYKKAIAEEVKSEKMRAFKWENVQEFISAIADFEQENREGSLEDFVATLSLERARDREKGPRGDLVNLMTFHSAKGLEFPVCFLVGVEDHLIPHQKSAAETGVDEERRLMYVAMTRAMRYLCISMAQTRRRMGVLSPSRPSRFLFEIPKGLLNVRSWDVIDIPAV